MTCNPRNVSEIPGSYVSCQILIVRECLSVAGVDVLTTVHTDGVTVQGDGSVATPVALKAVQHDGSLVGAGTVASPLSVVGGATPGAVYTAAESVGAGAPVIFSSVSHVANGRADVPANASVVAMATLDIAPTASGLFQFAGALTLTTAQWDARTGQVGGLTPGAKYYLDPITFGALTTVAPVAVGQAVVAIGRAMSAVQLVLSIQPAIAL